MSGEQRPMQYALWTRSGVHFYNFGSNGSKQQAATAAIASFENAQRFQYSKDGTMAAIVRLEDVLIVNTNPSSSSSSPVGTVITTLARPKVLRVAFSSLGTFVVTWERLDETAAGAEAANLLIWSLKTGEVVARFTKKAAPTVVSWPMIHWSPDDKFFTRSLTDGGFQVYSPSAGTNFSTPVLAVPGGGAVSVASLAWSPSPLRHLLAVFSVSRKGQPGSVIVYDCDVPSTSKTPLEMTRKSFFFEAETCQLEWSPAAARGGAPVLLAHAQSDIDPTGKSYYGASALFFVHATRSEFSGTVQLRKEGTIHHVAWHPSGKLFSVVYGYMPAMVTMFEVGAGGSYTAKSDLGPASRNITLWGPTGTSVCIGGFGNLQGEMDFFAVREAQSTIEETRFFRQGKAEAHTTTMWTWSPDATVLSTAICAPRRRVDNGYRVFNLRGEMVMNEAVNELYEFVWRPDQAMTNNARKAVLSNPNDIKQLQSVKPQTTPPPAATAVVVAAAVTPSQGKYRPPGARGLTPPVGPVGAAVATPPPPQQQTTELTSFYAPGERKKKQQQQEPTKDMFPSMGAADYLPGMAPDPKKAAAAVKRKQQKQKKQQQQQQDAPTIAVAASGDPAN